MENLQPSGEVLLGIYETAETIRYSDQRLRGLLTSGEIHIHYYSPCGQEIIPSAVVATLRPDDYMVTTYRGMHDQIAKGVPLREFFAENMGKVTGTCKGKGGPMHVTHPASGLMVTTGIVGSGLPIGNGLALASQLRGDSRVTVVNFGDGASNIGAFHEALNMAGLWKLPVVFVCQNNLYGERTSIELGTAITKISDRAASYGMPGVTVNGNDAAETWAAAKTAVELARDGGGPTLLEALTFRFFGHAFGDQDLYMPKEQKAAAVANDPLPQLRAALIEQGVVSDDEVVALETKIHAAVDDAVQFALDSDYPGLEELDIDVYA